ncbi:MAG TPA: hypothetical protein VM074_06630 [Solimonas sp.]|nr:hypothetical protein [Solimonas sp.]
MPRVDICVQCQEISDFQHTIPHRFLVRLDARIKPARLYSCAICRCVFVQAVNDGTLDVLMRCDPADGVGQVPQPEDTR